MWHGKIGEGKERKERQISKEKWRARVCVCDNMERVLKDAMVNMYMCDGHFPSFVSPSAIHPASLSD